MKWIARGLVSGWLVIVWLGSSVSAQQIPPPAGPVTFCGVQAAPAADTYQLVFDGGAPEALTMDATVHSMCPVGTTHSFQIPAMRFTVGSHTVQVVGTNPFGTTAGPVYAVEVGIKPGEFTINAVIQG